VQVCTSGNAPSPLVFVHCQLLRPFARYFQALQIIVNDFKCLEISWERAEELAMDKDEWICAIL